MGAVAWWQNFTEAPVIDGSQEGEEGAELTTPTIEGPLRLSGDRKEDYYTFLVIGRDTGGGGNTDTILLASYDVANQEMNIMSIPRDTMVNVSWDVKKINSVYNMYGGGDEGIDALSVEIAQLIGFVPDFQVILEWEAVGELVDALEGVYFDVPRDMYYVDPTQDLVIDLDAGYQLLDGEAAMEVVRFRDGVNGYANGDLGRIETQQDFLKAVIDQCLQLSNITRISELIEVFTNNVTTNLTTKNIAWFADQALTGGLNTDTMSFYTMPCSDGSVWSRSYEQNLSYVVPNTDELVALINEEFNPYLEPLEKTELDIMYVDSSGMIGSSTGYVEDTGANPALVQYRIDKAAAEEAALEEEASDSTETTNSTGETEAPDTEDSEEENAQGENPDSAVDTSENEEEHEGLEEIVESPETSLEEE